jgi:predicted ATPase
MNHLKIKHFKCFEDVNVLINNLTVMAGGNGFGKSTSIQALLYLRYTIEQCSDYIEYKNTGYVINKDSIGKKISLNSNYCLSLGNSSYVLNKNFEEDPTISIGIYNDKQELSFEFEVDNLEPQLSLKVKKIFNTTALDFEILTKEFYYLSAERIGPRLSQNFQYYEYPNAGFKGEFVAQLISEKGGLIKVDSSRFFENTTNPGLEFQVNEWLNDIMPGVKISAKQRAETQISQIQIENYYTMGDPNLATNIGFGISYILPIIATGLIAKEGSYFIVENPEAHLHPSAQSKIGEFLGIIAKAGVRVIVETHSDHIINGIQLAVVEKGLSHEDVTFNYFSYSKDINQPDVLPISIKESGELTDWPKGFFDQTQRDYSRLFNLKK